MSLEHQPELQFESAARQHESAKLSVWVFLSTEVMFFAALFAAYALYRYYFPEAFKEGSHHLDAVLGTIDTADLLTSSLFMALAIHCAKTNRRALTLLFLGLTMLLGAAFLVLHGHEYATDIREGALPGRFYHLETIRAPGASLFFTCYFFMTGLHTIHVAAGMSVIAWVTWRAAKGEFSSAYYTPVEGVGLYWHFVDMVWVFLYPMFYLVS